MSKPFPKGQKSVDGIFDTIWIVVQRESIMYFEMLNERQLLKEKHSEGLDGNFIHDKTDAQLSSSYHWQSMRFDVKKSMDKCRFCQHAKGKKQRTGLYQPLPIPDRS